MKNDFNKENAVRDYSEVIKQSWTYARLTESERERLWEELDSPCTKDSIKGNYDTRWGILQALYSMFLVGVGYTPFGWREEKEERA